MARVTEWHAMSAPPDYDGHYDVETASGVMDASFVAGSWQVDGASALRWRGRVTVLLKTEDSRLKEDLERRNNGQAYRHDAAQAALQIARSLQERVARRVSNGLLEKKFLKSVKKALLYFHIAVALQADLQTRDKDFMEEWWPRLKTKPKKALEDAANSFLKGESVRID